MAQFSHRVFSYYSLWSGALINFSDGGRGEGVKIRRGKKISNFSLRSARKIAVYNFARRTRRKTENAVYLLAF